MCLHSNGRRFRISNSNISSNYSQNAYLMLKNTPGDHIWGVEAMDLNWLRDFECLARTLNFTRASNERNITQSAFSRRIKALENWVGLPLVNRATYPIQLTEAGQNFLPTAKAAIAQLTESRQSIRDADRGDTRFVRISALHTISINYLAHQIERIQKEIPELRTRVISDSLSTCCELLLEGAVDIMLVYYHQYVSPKIDDTGFERKDLLSDKLIPVAARDAAQRQGWHLSNRDGAPIPHLAYEQSSFLGQVIENSISIEALNIETIYIDGLVETIRRRLLQGSGVAWMPQTAVETELQNGSLVAIGDQSLNISVTISALANPTYVDDSARKMWSLL